MTTLALLGLLVVLLVAIGIAAFLLRGRKRDEHGPAQAEQPAAPPRTVRDLVDHRRGLLERGGDTTPDGDGSGGDGRTVGAVDNTDGTEDAAEPPTVGRGATPADATTTDTDSTPGDANPGPAADAGAEPPTVSTGRSTASLPDPDPDPEAVPGPDGARPGQAAAASGVDPVAPVDDERTDVDTGPVGPPWSRGFVDGRPIEPPPAAAPHRPRPTPHARTTSGTSETGTSETGTAATGAVAAGAAATGAAAAAGVDADTTATAGTRSGTTATTAGTAATTPDTSVGEPVTPRPATPPRQESRSPVDPDLVKRVTAVPGDRSASSRTTAPDTDTAREFREARDRISGPTSTGRVPEQGGPAGTGSGRRPSPVPVPERDQSGQGERRDPDTSSTSAVTGAGIVAGTLGLGAAATGIAASRRAETAGAPTTADAATGHSAGTAGPAAPAAHEAVSGAAITAGGSDDDERPRPAPATRTGASGGPPLGPTGEPAPRPTPRLMRSSAPVAGADEDVAEEDVADDPDTIPTTPQEPPAGTTGTDGTISATTATAAPTATPTTATPTTATPTTATPTTAADALPDAPLPDESSPVVAFRHRPPEPSPSPVTGTARQDVEVRVSGRDAAPVGGVAVTVLDGTGHQIGSGTTDGGGAATLRVPGAGRYVVVSSADGYQPGVATCAVADDPARVSLTVTRSAAVRGVVRAGSGSPMAGVVVTLDQDGETVGRTDTGSDGAFRIADLGAGYYVLAAGTGAGAASRPVRLAAEADVEQDLRIAALMAAANGPARTRE